MRDSAATATFITTQTVETVAPDTGAGHLALQTMPSGASIADRPQHALVPADVGREDRQQPGQQGAAHARTTCS